MSRIKESPSHGASFRSSVHFEQVGLGGSPGSRKSLANAPSNSPSRSTTRNHPTDLPFSIFCHSPAADGSAGCAASSEASASTIAIGSINRNLASMLRMVAT